MPESRLRDNNTIGLTRLFSLLSLWKTSGILRFDTPVRHPYKRGSHGERGVPETSRVIAAKGFATLNGYRSAKGLGPRAVRSMHCLFGKGYASGGGRLRFQEREGFCRR